MFEKLKELALEKENYLEKMFANYEIEMKKIAEKIALDLGFNYDYVMIIDNQRYDYDLDLGFDLSIEYYNNLTDREIKQWIREFGIHPKDDEDFENAPFAFINFLIFADKIMVRKVYHPNETKQKEIKKYLKRTF